MKKLSVCVLFGGMSPEHEVSLRSAESVLNNMDHEKYNIFPVMKFIEEYMIPLKDSGLMWGYDIPYLLTGRLNQHPSSAIDYMKEERTDYTLFYIDLLDK